MKLKIAFVCALFFASQTMQGQISDSDNDGVIDAVDLCPGTAVGTQVNTYGCPVSLTNCDFNTANFNVVSAQAPIGKKTVYVLSDAIDGKIVQVSNSPTFSNLVGIKTYMVLAYSYEDNGTIVNLNPGNFLNQVSSSCGDWSNALPVKVCSPFIDSQICDFTTSSFSLNTVTPVPVGATSKYILVNQLGEIVKLSDTPTFSGISGTNTYNAYAISYTGTISNLSLGSNISNVTGSCLDWSTPLSIKVCVCNPICIPVSIVKIK